MLKALIIFVFLGFAFYLKRAWNANMDMARTVLRPLIHEEEFDRQGRVRERNLFLRRIALAQVRTVDLEQKMMAQYLAHVAVLIFLLVVLPLTSLILWAFFLITAAWSFLVWVARNHTRRVEGIMSRLPQEDQLEVGHLRHLETVRFRMK